MYFDFTKIADFQVELLRTYRVWSGAKVGVPSQKKLGKAPRKSRRKNCVNVGNANRNYQNLLQRNNNPKCATLVELETFCTTNV